jgi:putative flavoprotein involved in K+ transport
VNGANGSSPVRRVTTVIIGGGHAGLATSCCLSSHGIDHVVLERGEVANSWRRERWDSLRLLTPNWQSRLPGYRYRGDDPNGFMTMPEVIDFIHGYARASAAPVETGTEVRRVSKTDDGYRVLTNRGHWQCRCLVIASGAFNAPVVPTISSSLPSHIESLTPHQYRNPGQLAQGGVLVVGAASTGLQIADEIQRSGRPVTLAAGEHVRMPRCYRGRDIQYWMDQVGLLDECYEQVDDLRRVRRLPSAQLVGSPARLTLDLNALTAGGTRLVGRVAGIQGSTLQFSGSLGNIAKLADLKLGRLLSTIDEWIADKGGIAAAPERPQPTRVDQNPHLSMDLASGEIQTVIWCTGFRPDYSWLSLPVFDRKGAILHDGGVCEMPGLYAMGLPFMRRRKSSFMFGAEDDARDICNHLAAYIGAGAGMGIKRMISPR